MFKIKIRNQTFNYGYKIPKNSKGRRIVIPDIHGCANTFKELINKKVQITKEDQIFLLGDFIDRGKKNLETIDLILNLIERDYQIFPIRGNHEENLIEAWKDFRSLKHKKDKNFRDWINSTDLLDNKNLLLNRVINFLHILPYYYELDKFIIVHAGLNLNSKSPFQDFESMIRLRNKEFKKSFGKIIIHGHTVTSLSQIKEQIKSNSKILSIDNGCVFKKEYKSKKEIGNLIALNLDNYELHIQKNIEK